MDATRITLKESPDVMFGCVSGGSNFAGAVTPCLAGSGVDASCKDALMSRPRRLWHRWTHIGSPSFPYIGDTLQGHGDFDLAAYDDYLNGRIVDPEEPTEAIKRSISKLPEV